MAPKNKAPQRNASTMAKNAKRTAEQTPGGSRRSTRSTPATGAAPAAAMPSTRQQRKKSADVTPAQGRGVKKTPVPPARAMLDVSEASEDEEIPIAAAAAAAATAITALKEGDSNGAGPSKPPAAAKNGAGPSNIRSKSTRVAAAATTPAANGSARPLPLQVARQKLGGVKTPAKVIMITADACRKASTFTNRACYTGAVKISKEIPQISQTLLEMTLAARTRAGKPLSESAVMKDLKPEYATNLSWVRGNMALVTGKYIGFEFSAANESEIPVSLSEPTPWLVEFLSNCLKLDLCTMEQLKQFVSKESWKGARAYLLTDAEVLKLVKYGTHSKFEAAEVIENSVLIHDCVQIIDSLHSDMGRIEWAKLDDPEAAAAATEEYYAGDGDIDADDEEEEEMEFEKVDEGEDDDESDDE